jgi:hypothetical protein
MVRILNIFQGLISLVLVVASATLGWPIWVTIIGLIAPIAISLIIVISLREETPKGRTRETIEVASGFVLGVGGLLFWAFGSSNPTLESSTPWWFSLAALPSAIFNLGIYIAWLFYLICQFTAYAQKFLEYCSGETVVENYSAPGGMV